MVEFGQRIQRVLVNTVENSESNCSINQWFSIHDSNLKNVLIQLLLNVVYFTLGWWYLTWCKDFCRIYCKETFMNIQRVFFFFSSEICRKCSENENAPCFDNSRNWEVSTITFNRNVEHSTHSPTISQHPPMSITQCAQSANIVFPWCKFTHEKGVFIYNES